ncbi:hypothetical protein B0H17DRAFT_1139957 [Mycena rosella]|uniref:Uncharacterized protein n=1 Tax=Mycena rosella TaxID=1033263 RepID=A0AAD7G8A9_MYCRO|nr:hypothetical protein B0H17DRAFT_1139957 [Mycena rosella]
MAKAQAQLVNSTVDAGGLHEVRITAVTTSKLIHAVVLPHVVCHISRATLVEISKYKDESSAWPASEGGGDAVDRDPANAVNHFLTAYRGLADHRDVPLNSDDGDWVRPTWRRPVRSSSSSRTGAMEEAELLLDRTTLLHHWLEVRRMMAEVLLGMVTANPIQITWTRDITLRTRGPIMSTCQRRRAWKTRV